jgi:hypothetical protein
LVVGGLQGLISCFTDLKCYEIVFYTKEWIVRYGDEVKSNGFSSWCTIDTVNFIKGDQIVVELNFLQSLTEMVEV